VVWRDISMGDLKQAGAFAVVMVGWGEGDATRTCQFWRLWICRTQHAGSIVTPRGLRLRR
jgi:hypothetical protein